MSATIHHFPVVHRLIQRAQEQAQFLPSDADAADDLFPPPLLADDIAIPAMAGGLRSRARAASAGPRSLQAHRGVGGLLADLSAGADLRDRRDHGRADLRAGGTAGLHWSGPMTGRVLSGYRHDLQITYRATLSGHVLAVIFGGVLAGLVVFGWGL